MNKKIIPVFVTIAWLFSGLYFGIGGLSRLNFDETLKSLENNKESLMKEKISIINDGIEINNNYELQTHLELTSVEVAFPWAIKTSSFMALIITSFAFGLIGSVLSLIKEIVLNDKKIHEVKIWSTPVLGLLTGLVVLGISYLIPTILVKDGSGLQPITLMFFSLFAGIYTKNFYLKLTNYFNKLL